jgi:hypothetical protein
LVVIAPWYRAIGAERGRTAPKRRYAGLVAKKLTAIERVKTEAAKLGVPVQAVEPRPESGTVTFLAKRPAERFDELAPERDDDGSGTDE